ncbi:adenine deaminase C-terminal domain-containing protein [Chloroflexota bacterium]
MPKIREKTMTLTSRQMGQLVKVSLGEEKADLAIINGTLLNVYTGELLPDHGVAIKGERIAYAGKDVGHSIGPETEVIDAAGKTLVPGFIESHLHPDNYYTVYEFLRYCMRGGTTTAVAEWRDVFAHLGYRGIIEYLKSATNQPIKLLAVVPSIEPGSTAAEANIVSVQELRQLLMRHDVLGLGETFWQYVTQGDERVFELFAETLASRKKLFGHASGARNNKLVAYLASGISSCHESTTVEEALEKLRLGIYVLARQGEVRSDLEAISAIRHEGINLRRLVLVSDGVTPKHLVHNGHMEFLVQKAIDLGFDPVVAIQMATINAAECLSLDSVIGGIAPGKYADIVVIPDIGTIRAEYVVSNGRVIARDGNLLVRPRRHNFPGWFLRNINLPGKLEAADFAVTVEGPHSEVTVRVIDQVTDLVTRDVRVTMPVSGGEVKVDVSKDILKVAVIDPRRQPGRMFVGLIRGFKMTRGAFATSRPRDSSNIVVVGADEGDMALAVNRIAETMGGIVVCADGKILAELPLPIAGSLTDMPLEAVAQRLDDIQQEVASLGSPFADSHLALVYLTCFAVPFLRISVDGLVDIRESKPVDFIVQD